MESMGSSMSGVYKKTLVLWPGYPLKLSHRGYITANCSCTQVNSWKYSKVNRLEVEFLYLQGLICLHSWMVCAGWKAACNRRVELNQICVLISDFADVDRATQWLDIHVHRWNDMRQQGPIQRPLSACNRVILRKGGVIIWRLTKTVWS